MIKFSKFVDEKFGTGEAGKFKAALALRKSNKTIYNWYNSNAFWVLEDDKSFRVIEVKSELLK